MFIDEQSLTAVARAKTGSGKTAAYVLPILEAILRRKAVRLPYTVASCID